MNRHYFSAEEQNVCNLAIDLARGDFSAHIDTQKAGKKELEEHLRNTFNNEYLGGLSLYQAFRRNKVTVFEIMEEIINISIGEDVINYPFMEQFVEFKNRNLGDNTAFYTEGNSFLTVASFAGNHWDTNRESLDMGEEFTLPREWVYVHVYEELERFLLGIASLDRLTDAVYKSFNKYIKERIYVEFQSVADCVPTDFVKTGNSEEAIGNLCDVVAAAGGYSSLTIAGTRGALRKLAGVVPENMFADSQREARAKTGHIADWEGHKLMVIPQTLKPGTFELALDDNMLFILGGDVKPIKLEFVGDTRTKMVEDNNDMTTDFQIQTCFGMGMIIPKYFGIFNFA